MNIVLSYTLLLPAEMIYKICRIYRKDAREFIAKRLSILHHELKTSVEQPEPYNDKPICCYGDLGNFWLRHDENDNKWTRELVLFCIDEDDQIIFPFTHFKQCLKNLEDDDLFDCNVTGHMFEFYKLHEKQHTEENWCTFMETKRWNAFMDSKKHLFDKIKHK